MAEKDLVENKLQSGSTESIYKGKEGKLQEQRFDTLKNYPNSSNSIIAVLGIENQSS
ncbi:MAG: hypothetical protein HDR02_07830 [Lachnospiraceae bacterium]|nr:hypothetical protein [Lachnospiraceae bacterium]